MRPPHWTEITALFGGTFDPPHLGHLEAIHGLFEEPGIKRVLVLPSPTPPHKISQASPEDRIAMLRLALKELGARGADVELDLREIERARRSAALTYTFDTVQEIRQEIPQLAFVIGVDQLEKFHLWHRYSELLAHCHWLILARKPDGEARIHGVLKAWDASGLITPGKVPGVWKVKGADSWIRLIPTPARDISSTRIREEISKTGQPPKNSLPESVKGYLMTHRLYGSNRTEYADD